MHHDHRGSAHRAVFLPFEPRQLEALGLATLIGLLMGLRARAPPGGPRRRPHLRPHRAARRAGRPARRPLRHPGVDDRRFVLVAALIIAANFRQPEPNDPGTTSVIALLVCYCLGAMVWLGYGRLAVMAAVGSTMLLYFKSELRGVASRLTSQDWRSVLQFSVLSLIVLPILPNRGFAPTTRSTRTRCG